MSMSHLWLDPLAFNPTMFLFSMFKFNLVGRHQALKLCSKDAPWNVLSNDLLNICKGRPKPKSSVPETDDFYIKLAPVKTICVLRKQLKMVNMSMSHLCLDPIAFLPTMFLFSMFKHNLAGRHQALRLERCALKGPIQRPTKNLQRTPKAHVVRAWNWLLLHKISTRQNNMLAW